MAIGPARTWSRARVPRAAAGREHCPPRSGEAARPVTRRRDFPTLDPVELRRYLPALRLADAALEERRGDLEERFEPVTLRVLEDAREDLRELRERLRTA